LRKASYHHGNLREALVEAALGLIAEHGVAGLTMRSVGKTVGVSHAAPYRHFKDKEAILAAVATEGFVLMRDAMAAARDGAGSDLMERLAVCGRAYIHFAVRHPSHYRVMFGPATRNKMEHPELLGASLEAFGIILGGIEEAQAAGLLRDGETIELGIVAWSQAHGLSMLLIDDLFELGEISDEALEGYAQRASDVIDTGIRRR
jgi:AcrR family transcriptional regulator